MKTDFPTTSDTSATGAARGSRLRGRLTLLLAVLILVPSVWGFGSKFLEFLHLFREREEGAFAIAPVTNYLLASCGFFLAFLWAIANGMFHDIEAPKYRMLDTERRLDRAAHVEDGHQPRV